MPLRTDLTFLWIVSAISKKNICGLLHDQYYSNSLRTLMCKHDGNQNTKHLYLNLMKTKQTLSIDDLKIPLQTRRHKDFSQKQLTKQKYIT